MVVILDATDGALPSQINRKSHRMALRTPPTRPGFASAGATTWLVTAGVILAAFNLRTAVTSVGPLLDEIQTGLGMSAAIAGVLTTLPVMAFAAIGAITPRLDRRFGARVTLMGALTLMSLGLLVRSTIDSVPVFLLFSALALVGGAVGNVILPSVVKRYFPQRIGQLTTIYSTALAVGTMVAAALTVPVADLFSHQWRPALGIWALPAAIAVLPWLLMRGPAPAPEPTDTATDTDAPHPARAVTGLARNRLAWMMMFSFGSQSLIAYVMFGWLPVLLRDHGYSSQQAGFMLGIFTAISIPISLAVPVLAARLATQRPILIVLFGGYILGMPALWLGGVSALTWLGLGLLAIGMGTFPLMLTLFALRTKTSAGTSALSAFAQSGGYLIAGIGPVLVGVLYEATGAWTLPFALLIIAAIVHIATGWYVTNNRYLEDEEPSQPLPQPAPSDCTDLTTAARM